MKSILLAMVLMAANSDAKDEMAKVAVCLNYESVEFNEAQRARLVASQIYAQIGVKLEWLFCGSKRDGDVVIWFRHKAPNDLAPEVLAWALPYEGKTIEVFHDRVRQSTHSYLGDLMGHVLAHEIAHVLQGIARHSQSGVLKPSWSAKERLAMSFRPLQFTQHDAELIRQGVSVRAGKRASTLAASNSRP
jgi:hypothetical protein